MCGFFEISRRAWFGITSATNDSDVKQRISRSAVDTVHLWSFLLKTTIVGCVICGKLITLTRKVEATHRENKPALCRYCARTGKHESEVNKLLFRMYVKITWQISFPLKVPALAFLLFAAKFFPLKLVYRLPINVSFGHVRDRQA